MAAHPGGHEAADREYYACITGLDYHVGRIFAELKASGEWDNTLIVFSGDNGLSLGEHGLFGKQNLYEFGGMHVPLVFAGPDIPKGESDALVYLMDLFPTLPTSAERPCPAGVEGKDLRPLLEGKAAKVRDVLYTAIATCSARCATIGGSSSAIRRWIAHSSSISRPIRTSCATSRTSSPQKRGDDCAAGAGNEALRRPVHPYRCKPETRRVDTAGGAGSRSRSEAVADLVPPAERSPI